MKHRWPLVTLLLVVCTATAAAPTSLAARARQPLLATLDGPSTSRLFYVDPVTLERVTGRSLTLGFYWGDFVRSPDGSMLALSRNDAPALRFVRLPGLRFAAGAMTFSQGTFVQLVAWPSTRLLYALLQSSPERLLAIDPIARRVLWQRAVPGSVLVIQPAGQRVVALAAPSALIGSATVMIIGPNGSVRSRVLEGIRAGFHALGHSQDPIGRLRSPALAIDPDGGRAYVVGADERVAQVDLTSGRVTYHLGQGGQAQAAKATRGTRQEAMWLGGGWLAVTGDELSVASDGHGDTTQVSTPTGLALIDTRTWTRTSLQHGTDSLITVGRWLLAYGVGYGTPATTAADRGVTVYRLNGTHVRHLLGHTAVAWAQFQDGLVYLWLASGSVAEHVIVLDPASGRVLARETRSLVLLARS